MTKASRYLLFQVKMHLVKYIYLHLIVVTVFCLQSCGREATVRLNKDLAEISKEIAPEPLVITETKKRPEENTLKTVTDTQGNTVSFNPDNLFIKSDALSDTCYFKFTSHDKSAIFSLSEIMGIEQQAITCKDLEWSDCDLRNFEISLYSQEGAICDVRVHVKGFLIGGFVGLSDLEKRRTVPKLKISECSIPHECFYDKGWTITRLEQNTFEFNYENDKRYEIIIYKYLPNLMEVNNFELYSKFYEEILMKPIR